MYLIVGLGNPEGEYENTRHNMGFWAVNKLAKKYEIDLSRKKFNGIYGSGIIEGEKVILLKPQTYMNLSGDSLIEFKNFYKLENSELIVIFDDVDLEPGDIRIKTKGSGGSHNGAKSVVYRLQSEEFIRVRIGIGTPEHDIISHVIGAIDEEDNKLLEEGTEKVVEAIKEIMQNGIISAMNKFN